MGMTDRTTQLLNALAVISDAEATCRLAAELLFEQLECQQLTLVSAISSTRFRTVSVVRVDARNFSSTVLEVSSTLELLASRTALVELVTSGASVAEVDVEAVLWTDVGAAVVVDQRAAARLTQHYSLALVSRRLLSCCVGTPVVLPCPEQLEAMAEFSAGAGHEINNPLASILAFSSAMLKTEQRIEQRQSLETIAAQAWRVRDMIGNAMTFARPPQCRREQHDLSEVVHAAATAQQHRAESLGVSLNLTAVENAVELYADRTQMGVLWEQLLRNALDSLDSAGSGGRIRVKLQQLPSGVILGSVCDDGPGFRSEADRRNAFNPFYSGRSAGRGLGFGLCLAWRAVQVHGGILLLEPGVGAGVQASFALAAGTVIAASSEG